MKRKTLLLILASVLLMSVSLQAISSGQYYEADGILYGDHFLDRHDRHMSDEYNDKDPNQVLIEFRKDGSIAIDVSASDHPYGLADQLYECICNQALDPDANITTLKNELAEICKSSGIAKPNITLASPYGNDTFIYSSTASGISMYPTIKNGQTVIINKTHDVHIGDLVAAKYPSKHGSIIKRVAEIRGDELYLISDNVNGSYEKNGKVYEYEGLRTWVSMSDIQGVVIDIQNTQTILV